MRLGHEGCASLLPTGHKTNALTPLVQAVEYGQITFSGNSEAMSNALGNQAIDKKVTRNL
jgi:hypothetical protein